MHSHSPREGDIFKVLHIGGHSFTIRYGYYTESERGNTEPIPLYPCFLCEPHYDPDGFPLITRIQDACEHYIPLSGEDGDGWCADCIYCNTDNEPIGICQCLHRRCVPSPQLHLHNSSSIYLTAASPLETAQHKEETL